MFRERGESDKFDKFETDSDKIFSKLFLKLIFKLLEERFVLIFFKMLEFKIFELFSLRLIFKASRSKLMDI